MNWGELSLAAVGSGALSAVITAWLASKKTKAEAASIAMDGTVRWAESMRKDIEALKLEQASLREKYISLLEENKNLHIEVARLRSELSIYKQGS